MAEGVSGHIDADGRLVAAGARLLALHQRAGGEPGEALAVPALAGLARLARSLNILISRSVIVAEGDHDLDLLVRARPDGDGVALVVGGWTPRPQRRPWLTAETAAYETPVASARSWRWTTDGALRLTAIDGLETDTNLIGQPLTRLVRLIEDETGDLPIIGALAGRQGFENQRATLRADPTREITLSAGALVDAQGLLTGFDGVASAAASQSVSGEDEVPVIDTVFAERLDGALRAPLARIVENADSISAQTDGPLRRDYADYASDIGSAARHLLALVDDLSDLQAIERPDFQVEADEIDLADLARRAAGLLQVRALDRRVRIDRPGTDETLPARGEFRRVLQILVNLVGNAVRYSPTDSMVWIRTERDADTAVIIVADQGKGISVEDQARIFDKFERVDPSEPDGSGLGLFIARRLAQAMGGDIVVDSAPGQGARFVLTLPAA